MEKIPMRDGYGNGLLKMCGEDRNIMVLDADVSKSTRTNWVAQQYPDHFRIVSLPRVEVLQEAMAAKAYYKADKAIVVTNRYFTASACTLASVNDVQLIDREVLFGIKPTYQEEKSQR